MTNLKRGKATARVAPLPDSTPTPTTMPVELMTVTQAATFAQVSQSTIRRWIRCEGLAAYRSKGCVRIDKVDILKFLKVDHSQQLLSS